jgi:hypothetical protein
MGFSKSHPALLVIFLAAVLAGIGCGSSSDDSSDGGSGGSGGSLTKAEFIKQGDQLCVKADKEKQAKIEAFTEAEGSGPENVLTARDEEGFMLTAVLPPIQAETEELEALGVPDPQAQAIIDGMEKAIAQSEVEARKGTPKNIDPEDVVDPFAKVSQQARAYGFKSCLRFY